MTTIPTIEELKAQMRKDFGRTEAWVSAAAIEVLMDASYALGEMNERAKHKRQEVNKR